MVPGGGPGGLQSMGPHRVWHDWSEVAHKHTRRTECWFDTLIYCAVIITVELLTSVSSHNYRFCLVRAFKIYSLTLFQVYNAILSPIISLLPWIPRTDLSYNWKFTVSGLRCKSLFRVRLTFCEWCKVVVVQSLSHVWLFTAPWTVVHQASLSFIISHSLFKLMSIEPMMPSNRLILWRPLLPPSIFPSIGVFSSESALHIRGQSTGASASASVLPMNIQGWFPLGWTSLSSLQSTVLSRVFSSTTVQRHQLFLGVQFYACDDPSVCDFSVFLVPFIEETVLSPWVFLAPLSGLVFSGVCFWFLILLH